MKKLLIFISVFLIAENISEARGGGGGFHGGGGGFHGGASRGGASRSGSRSGSRSSASQSHANTSHNGNTYNHTNNFYGGGYHGGFGWGGAWAAFGFTALTTTSIALAASANGGGQANRQLEKALMEIQVEMEQLEKRLDGLENKQGASQEDNNDQKSPLNDANQIKAYMEKLKSAKAQLLEAQSKQSPQVVDKIENDSSEQLSDRTQKLEKKRAQLKALEASENTADLTDEEDQVIQPVTEPASTDEKIMSLQDRLTNLKAQLYDYWFGNNDIDGKA